jgi:microsomal dipeptidase-like Zn-dependent dipeptidase
MNRRDFLSRIGGGVAAAAVLGGVDPARLAARHGHGVLQERPLILDAMGEIRLTHPMELIHEVLDSGTNMVCVTLTDPKVFGEAALDAALDDLLAYDRHIEQHSDLLLKATSVADIHRAREGGKLALFYLLQNTTPVHKDLDRVDMLRGLGLTSLQLTYNYQNYVGSGCPRAGGADERGRHARGYVPREHAHHG